MQYITIDKLYINIGTKNPLNMTAITVCWYSLPSNSSRPSLGDCHTLPLQSWLAALLYLQGLDKKLNNSKTICVFYMKI